MLKLHIFFISTVALALVCVASGIQTLTVAASAPSVAKHGLVFEGSNWTGLTATDTQTLSNEAIGTGVKWVTLSIYWGYSEPSAPTSSCQPSQGPHCYKGPKAAYHNYNFTTLDRMVNALYAGGINVGIRFFLAPQWATGATCSGFSSACGAILSTKMTTFQNNIYDLAFNMATRYKGKIAYWTIWNEPNLAYSFSPQDLNLGSGYLTNEYMDLVQIPAHGAITTVIPGALTVGPDLYTPNGGGQVETCDYYNHCMWLYGTGEWEDAMLRYFDSYFPTFSIHNNSDTDVGANAAVGNTWNLVMVPLGKQRNIWLSEYNFGNNGTCSNSEQTLANYTRNLYTNMGNQRDFYFSLTDGWGTPACGDGIVWGQGYNWAEKSVLYPAFTNIVGTT